MVRPIGFGVLETSLEATWTAPVVREVCAKQNAMRCVGAYTHPLPSATDARPLNADTTLAMVGISRLPLWCCMWVLIGVDRQIGATQEQNCQH